jgi:hypothetical protein
VEISNSFCPTKKGHEGVGEVVGEVGVEEGVIGEELVLDERL